MSGPRITEGAGIPERGGSRRPANALQAQPVLVADTLTGERKYEWLYLTPRYPNGILDGVLRLVEPEVQRETALFWFFANLRPHSRYAEDIGTVGQTAGTARPSGVDADAHLSPVDALDVLREEFASVLPNEVVYGLGEFLGFGWVWIEDARKARAVVEQREAAALALQDLADMLRETTPRHGGPGHNQPDGIPLSGEDRDEALRSIEDIQKQLRRGKPVQPHWLSKKWAPVQKAITAFGGWAMALADRCITTLCEEGARATGRALPYLIVVGVGVYHQGPWVLRLLEALAPK